MLAIRQSRSRNFFFWVHSFKEKKPLKYIGYGGTGFQVRDGLHPSDLVPLLMRQIYEPNLDAPKVVNLGGGIENSLSLKELSNWCEKRFGTNEIFSSHEQRPMDAPWIVMDSSVAQNTWNWKPTVGIDEILEEIANFADEHPHWLSLQPKLMKINFCDLALPENSERTFGIKPSCWLKITVLS